MGWNPSFDVLSGILGDARQYVDQNTREKKAANLKFLDRVYAEKQLGKDRQYQEALTGRNRDYNEALTGRNRDYEDTQAGLERERARQQAAEQLMGSMGYYGAGGANLPLTPDQLERATDYHGKMFERKRLTDEADRELVEANTRKADRWQPTVSTPAQPPPYLSSRLTGPALAEQQNRALISMGGTGGVLDIGLHTPELSESFRQVIGRDADVWQEMLQGMAGVEQPIAFLEAIKLLESNEDPTKVAGIVNNIKARMIPIIKKSMTKRLRQFDNQRFSALADKDKEGFIHYASVLESGMERQAEQIFNNMIGKMMYDPKTGKITDGQKQPAAPLSKEQIQKKAREERRANMTHEDRWAEDMGYLPRKKKTDPNGASKGGWDGGPLPANKTVGEVLQIARPDPRLVANLNYSEKIAEEIENIRQLEGLAREQPENTQVLQIIAISKGILKDLLIKQKQENDG